MFSGTSMNNVRSSNVRIGHGYDIHKLVEGLPMRLGGVDIEFDKGPEGHSDGDVVAHAVVDALLGAACLGDIGIYFPPGDERFKDANSMDFLKYVKQMMSERSMVIGNIDCTIVCQAPKLAPYFKLMSKAMSKALGIAQHQISVKAKTAEGLGPIGAGEAIEAHVVALIEASGPAPVE